MKKIFRNLAITIAPLSALTLPMVASSCCDCKLNTTKQNQANLKNSIQTYKNLSEKYTNQSINFMITLADQTKADALLKPYVDKVYEEQSLNNPTFENLFFSYYNGKKSKGDVEKELTKTYQDIFQPALEMDMTEPFMYIQRLSKTEQALSNLSNFYLQTYLQILNELKVDKNDKYEEYFNKFDTDFRQNVAVFYGLSNVYTKTLQQFIKVYGINDMLIHFQDKKDVNKDIKKLAYENVVRSTQYIIDTNKKFNNYSVQEITKFTTDDLNTLTNDISGYINTNIYNPFYEKLQNAVIKSRYPETQVQSIFNKSPVYYQLQYKNNAKDENLTNTLESIKETLKDKPEANNAIETFKVYMDNHGYNVTTINKVNDFANARPAELQSAVQHFY
ncbi:hypothetical protein [Mycoplasmopsis verecunda]|nr:hypothetical protein [Mycoplasmopsis verecunda]WPB54750.1 hypothetical protein SAM46_01165 [Mycoplasmopsis verecunda]